MDLERRFAERIVRLMDLAETYDVDSPERKAIMREIVDLGNLGRDLAKINSEHEDRIKSQEIDRNLRISQLKEDRKERFAKYGFEVGKIFVGIIATYGFACMAYGHETNGTVPMTQVGREHVRQGFRFRW